MFLPENIDLAHSEKYILSIRLTPNGFSFCISSPSDKSVSHFQEWALSKNLSLIENIKKTFFEVNFFTQPFKKVSVTVVSPRYTLVPDAYFEKKNTKTMFEFNIHGAAGHVLSNYIAENSLHVLFDLDEEVYSFLSRNLSNPSFRAYTSELLPFFAAHNAEGDKKRCFVEFHDEMITVICFAGEKLLSANTYPNTDRFDALYYIVSVWEKHSLDQNTDRLFVSGNLKDNHETVETLKQLIKNVINVEHQTSNVKHQIS